MSAKHTPGPWLAREDPQVPERGRCYIEAVTPYGDLDGGHEVIAEAYQLNMAEDNEQREANARLIAAAPTMRDFIAKKAAEGDLDATRILEAINAGR